MTSRPTEFITSKANPLVKDILGLRRSKRRRRDEGITLVEGFKILSLAMASGCHPVVVLYDPQTLTDEERPILVQARSLGGTVRAVSKAVLTVASVREGPMACVASVRLSEWTLDDVQLSPTPLVLVIERLEKPGNMGALARTASAGGADVMIAADSQTDIFSPATVHASLGAVFALPVVRCTGAEARAWLRDHGITVVATSPGADRYYFEIDMARSVAIAVGNEHRGLSDDWLVEGELALIPMSGTMNSLNATTAGGIVLFDALRQRIEAKGATA